MKKFLATLVAALLIAPVAIARPPRGVNDTNLPEDAKTFLNKHFNGVTIDDIDREKGRYEVELVDNTDIDFDSRGKLIKIDAGNSKILATGLVKEIIPDKIYTQLEGMGVVNTIESVKIGRRGYKIELENANPDEYYFDKSGNLVSHDN